jgi:two-component system, chemotaxis family, chemotaxis protein CheY
VSKRILIADDSNSVRRVVRRWLESRGLTVCGEAADGLEAIDKVRELKPDLILLDLAMPKLNGAAAASVIKKSMPKVPIILFTMYEDAVDSLASAVGVDMVLSKPDGINNLVERVEHLLDSKQPSCASGAPLGMK